MLVRCHRLPVGIIARVLQPALQQGIEGAIDLVYLAADGTVVKTCSGLKPFRFSAGGRRARSVLELPAGFLESRPTVVGEKLAMSPVAKKG